MTCDFKSGKIILQQPVAREQMTKLLATGKTDLLEGFVSNKTRRKFKARLAYGTRRRGKVVFEFEPRPPRVGKTCAGQASAGKTLMARRPPLPMTASAKTVPGKAPAKKATARKAPAKKAPAQEGGGEEVRLKSPPLWGQCRAVRRGKKVAARKTWRVARFARRHSMAADLNFLSARSTRWTATVGLAAMLMTGSALAQTPTGRKPPPRLPPSPSEQARIPAGVDTGTPGTSDTLPLGTPVPPSVSADRGDLRLRSAAARSAARKNGPVAAGTSASAARADCPSVGPSGNPNGEAVALPGSGFTGQSASPKTAAAAADKRPAVRVAC